nr:cytochrome c oxidase subunit II [Novosphingobium aquimarinum]
MRLRRLAATAILLITGCNRHQSALAPFGAEADDTLSLTIVLASGAAVIALGVVLLVWNASRAREHALSESGGLRLVLWAGAIFPTVVLTVLLLFALPAMRPLPESDADLRIQVEGEQFWWRVRYAPPGAAPLMAANEVRVPVGRTVVFELTATDVIHSFWIPGLAGKMDMIPGRTNQLVVRATKPGTFRGVCTEFCGLSHALMAFDVIAMEPAAFDAWLAEARRTERASSGRGAQAFDRRGCGACHAIAGTPHHAVIGPDLTHYSERLTLGAGILEPTVANTAAFIRDPSAFKPGARMPAYAAMPQAEAEAIARYLKGAP